MKARLYIDIQFGKRATDAESMATALDNVLDTGMVQLSDCWDEYGGKPKVGKFFVLDTEQALGFAEELDRLVHGWDDDLGKSLAPIRDFLRQVAGKRRA
ncbi:MAG: hypothetical protein ACLQNE_38410 [Thermoguttaceae bacterium]